MQQILSILNAPREAAFHGGEVGKQTVPQNNVCGMFCEGTESIMCQGTFLTVRGVLPADALAGAQRQARKAGLLLLVRAGAFDGRLQHDLVRDRGELEHVD